jgi:hypothetical protein
LATPPTTGSAAAAPEDSPGSTSASGLEPRSSVATPSATVLAPPVERPHTRLQSGVTKPKKFTNGTIRYAYFCSTSEPSSPAEAFID